MKCVRTGVRYVITKFSGMDGLPNFLTHGAPLRARFACAGAPLLSIANASDFRCMISTFLVSDSHVIKQQQQQQQHEVFHGAIPCTSCYDFDPSNTKLTPSEAIGQKRRPSPPFQSLCNTKGPKACIQFGKCQLADCSKSNNCAKCRQVCLGKKILITKTSFV